MPAEVKAVVSVQIAVLKEDSSMKKFRISEQISIKVLKENALFFI